MTLPAKQARNILLSLAFATGICTSAILVHPISLEKPTRQDYPGQKYIFAGARKMMNLESASAAKQMFSKREIAMGSLRKSVATLKNGREVVVTEIPLRVRDFNNFEMKRMKDLFMLKSSDEERSMDKERTEGVYVSGSDRILVSYSGKELKSEGCITTDGIANVSQNRLIEAVRQRALSRRERWMSILGLRQPREWKCLYVSVILSWPTKDFTEATSAWRSLRQRAGN